MKHYPLFKAHVPVDGTLEQIKEVLTSGFINEGVQVTRLTEALKQELETEQIIMTNSCTSALTMALHLAGVGPGDEVISTPMTCVASNTPIIALGGKIVWADIDYSDGMIQPWAVEDLISERTKAIVAVAWAGTPPKLSALRRICDEAGVSLILDAAHAFGARFNDKPIHEWADHTCYSFQAIKHFTTGDGGALVCHDLSDYQRSKALKWFGLDRDATKDVNGNWKGQQWDADITEAGYKFNMNNVAAAIGLSQLPHINNIIATHRRNAALFDTFFGDTSGIVRHVRRPQGSTSSFWVYTVLLDPQRSKLSRDGLLATLNEEGIMAGLVHVPNDSYTAFKEFRSDLPGTRAFAERQFSLPCGWWLTEDDVVHIARRVIELTS